MQAAAWRSRDNKNANDSKLEGPIKDEANKRLERVQEGAHAQLRYLHLRLGSTGRSVQHMQVERAG